MEKSMVFMSYSHKNQALFDEFGIHLKPLFAERLVLWSDKQIKAGQKWDEEIKKALQNCYIGVMLVSPTFLASDYISKIEIPILLERAENQKIRLLCLYLHTSVVDQTEFTITLNGEKRSIKLTNYQGLNSPDSPLEKLSNARRGQEFRSAALQLKEIQDSLAPSANSKPEAGASAPRQSEQKQLSVVLNRTNEYLCRTFHCFGNGMQETQLPFNGRVRELLYWNGLAPLENLGDRLFDALFGGLDEQALRELLASAWQKTSSNSNPIAFPLRVKIFSEDLAFMRLPWQQSTWENHKLVESGWTFEWLAVHPTHVIPSSELSIETPMPIRLILPDSGPSALFATNHYESLCYAFNRIWSDRHYPKAARCSQWRADCQKSSALSEPIVYLYTSASIQNALVMLDFPDQSVDLDTLSRSLAKHCRAKIVFLNLCCENPDPILQAMPEFSREFALVVLQTFDAAEHFEAERAAIDWLQAVLEDGDDPVRAINESGTRRASAWANFDHWKACLTQDSKPLRMELGKLLLDRHRQRETISTNARLALRNLDSRVIATVASGQTSDLLELFHRQIFETLKSDLSSVATVHQTQIRMRADTNNLEDIEDELYRAFHASSHKKLRSLWEDRLAEKARRDQSAFWILHWEPQGSSLGREFTLERFRLWEEFCRTHLARNCPDRLRILCLMALETDQPERVKNSRTGASATQPIEPTVFSTSMRSVVSKRRISRNFYNAAKSTARMSCCTHCPDSLCAMPRADYSTNRSNCSKQDSNKAGSS